MRETNNIREILLWIYRSSRVRMILKAFRLEITHSKSESKWKAREGREMHNWNSKERNGR